MKIRYKMSCLSIFFVFIISFPLFAADAPDDVILYRKKVMRGISQHMGAIGDVLKKKVSYSSHILGHAQGINLNSKMITDVFPESSKNGKEKKTRSHLDIWKKWGDFEKASNALTDASAQLITAAESGDMAKIGAAMKEVGKSCGGCHKPFRLKKEEAR